MALSIIYSINICRCLNSLELLHCSRCIGVLLHSITGFELRLLPCAFQNAFHMMHSYHDSILAAASVLCYMLGWHVSHWRVRCVPSVGSDYRNGLIDVLSVSFSWCAALRLSRLFFHAAKIMSSLARCHLWRTSGPMQLNQRTYRSIRNVLMSWSEAQLPVHQVHPWMPWCPHGNSFLNHCNATCVNYMKAMTTNCATFLSFGWFLMLPFLQEFFFRDSICATSHRRCRGHRCNHWCYRWAIGFASCTPCSSKRWWSDVCHHRSSNSKVGKGRRDPPKGLQFNSLQAF